MIRAPPQCQCDGLLQPALLPPPPPSTTRCVRHEHTFVLAQNVCEESCANEENARRAKNHSGGPRAGWLGGWHSIHNWRNRRNGSGRGKLSFWRATQRAKFFVGSLVRTYAHTHTLLVLFLFLPFLKHLGAGGWAGRPVTRSSVHSLGSWTVKADRGGKVKQEAWSRSRGSVKGH